jgi:hypothetical protein
VNETWEEFWICQDNDTGILDPQRGIGDICRIGAHHSSEEDSEKVLSEIVRPLVGKLDVHTQ